MKSEIQKTNIPNPQKDLSFFAIYFIKAKRAWIAYANYAAAYYAFAAAGYSKQAA